MRGSTRTRFSMAAAALFGAAVLASCAPAPTPVEPPTGPTSTKSFELSCNVTIPGLGTISASNPATVTMSGVDPTPSGTGIDLTIDISGGVKNGPIAATSGTVTVFTSLNGEAAVESAPVNLGPTPASAYFAVPTINTTTDPVVAEATVNLTRINYTAQTDSGSASGSCAIPAGDQPVILVGVS